MDYDYDYVVVGRGLMGSAAARHLSNQGYSVALVGPSEPIDWHRHQGVFASHYDEGRITRILDPNLYWAQLAQRSITRYRSLESQTGITFYQEVGHLAIGQRHGESGKYLADLETVASRLELSIDVLDSRRMQEQFPYFRIGTDLVGFYQLYQAGYISPRIHISAQSKAVEMNGSVIIDDFVISIHEDILGITVETNSTFIKARSAIIATGGFTKANGLISLDMPLTIRGHTVLLAEVKETDLPTLSGMPSVIHKPVNRSAHFYLLPPIQYPDGRQYIKIGCPSKKVLTDDLTSLHRWFKSPGEKDITEHLLLLLKNLMPDINFTSLTSKPCITTDTHTGFPIIDWVKSERLLGLLGGNGRAGKSADELGFIAAQLLIQRDWGYDLPVELFKEV